MGCHASPSNRTISDISVWHWLALVVLFDRGDDHLAGQRTHGIAHAQLRRQDSPGVCDGMGVAGRTGLRKFSLL